MNLKELLGDPTWLFHLGFPIRSMTKRVMSPERLDWQLDDEHLIPSMGTLSDGATFAKVCMAWSANGFFIHCKVTKIPSWTPTVTMGSTPHLTFYIDTRWSPDVHRATSFCHRFDFSCDRPTSSEPIKRGHGELNAVQRARATPNDVHPSQLSVATSIQKAGYDVKAFIPTDALTGYSPEDYQEIGVFYSLYDPNMGHQLIARTLESKFFEDPTLWCHAKLISI